MNNLYNNYKYIDIISLTLQTNTSFYNVSVYSYSDLYIYNSTPGGSRTRTDISVQKILSLSRATYFATGAKNVILFLLKICNLLN